MRVFPKVLKFFVVLGSIIHVTLVKSDLPIHVEIKDLVGKWTIEATAGHDSISSCGSSLPNNNIDNLKINDYKQYLLENKYELVNKLNVILSDDYVLYGDINDTTEHAHRKNWKVLAVYDEKKRVIGSWTTIYDEGFEIRIGNETYTALIHYTSNGECKVEKGDALDSNGETDCYETVPSKIRFGWFDISEAGKKPLYGCFYAERDDTVELKTSDIEQKEGENEYEEFAIKNNMLYGHNVSSSKEDKKQSAYKKLFSQKDIIADDENTELHWHKLKHHGKKKQIVDKVMLKNLKQKYACPCTNQENVENVEHKEKSLNIVSHSLLQMRDNDLLHSALYDETNSNNQLDLEAYASEQKNVREMDINELPANFTWGDPFNNNAREYDVLNQLKCGSCYIASLLYVLKRRIEISLTKKFNKNFLKNFDDNLSIQSILSCSFFDQGCYGGYPFLVSKYVKLQGIPVERCLPYTASDQPCPLAIDKSFIPLNNAGTDIISDIDNGLQSAQSNLNGNRRGTKKKHINGNRFNANVCDKANRWYVKSYNYIGGCYGCNQCNGEKIMMNELYRNGPIVTSFEATPNFYNYEDGIYYEEDYEHAKRCTMRKERLKDFNVTGWERVNHAIVLVGWGEEVIDGIKHKYWIARNSWGVNWGKDGYFKIIRGVNFNAVESHNIFVDPDFTRGAGAQILHELQMEFNKK